MLAVGVAVIGDSLSADYSYEIPANELLPTSAKSWVQLLAQNRATNVNFGSLGAAGYAYDLAQYGATSSTMFSEGQVSGVIQQIKSGQVQYVILAIGQNDFSILGSAYKAIYSGSMSVAQICAYETTVLNNIETAMADFKGKLVVGDIIDPGETPLARLLYPDAAHRELVASVITQLNTKIAAAASSMGAPFVDLDLFTQSILGSDSNPIAMQKIGGEVFVNAAGFGPYSDFIFDRVHPSTVPQALIANLFVDALDNGYDLQIAPFRQQEIVGLVGLPYLGESPAINYDSFVTTN
ncbi:MAG: SGNH/GDSL hydrolase family protein [Thermoguttaceae bacterium]|jgi:hypothetical protein